MSPVNGRRRLLIGLLLINVAGFLPASSDEAEDPMRSAPADIDCGLASLYLLLRLEGHSVSLSPLAAQLPPRPAEGYSMKDLRDAARLIGLRLNGIRLLPEKPFPRSNSLAFVNRDGHGHFLVIRSVGHSGKLVQVFDGFGGPVVMDWVNLRKSSEWTGLVLLPDATNWRTRIGVIVIAMTLAIILVHAREKRRRSAISTA